jgi:hypothetical protein
MKEILKNICSTLLSDEYGQANVPRPFIPKEPLWLDISRIDITHNMDEPVPLYYSSIVSFLFHLKTSDGTPSYDGFENISDDGDLPESDEGKEHICVICLQGFGDKSAVESHAKRCKWVNRKWCLPLKQGFLRKGLSFHSQIHSS